MRCQLNARILAAYGVLASAQKREWVARLPDGNATLTYSNADGLGTIFVNAYSYRHTFAAPNTISVTRID
jgi:hypothetical protein